MKTFFLLAVVGVAFTLNIPFDSIPRFAVNLKGQERVDYINSVQKLWKAELNKNPRREALMAIKHTKLPADVEFAEPIVASSIPDSFDARTQWSKCPSIGEIRDQSNCGSCWAFAAAESMSDRICIETNGATQVTLSADDLLSCCGTFCGFGCEGGYPIQAWRWFISTGVVTGGGFYENTFCKPYPIEPCGITTDENGVTHNHTCPSGEASTPPCSKSCNSGYPTPYTQDKHFGKKAYAVTQDVDVIKTEILNNGPVEAAFTVYEDFYDYTTGIYKHVTGAALGGHAVKILGWGSENGTPYWLVANSWNTNWGEDGFFRIFLGDNECGIEEAIVAGLASV